MKATLAAVAMLLQAGTSAAGEPTGCRAVPEAESHLAVLFSRADVVRVEALDGKRGQLDPTVPVGSGARIVLAARSFVTVEWLQRAIDCHVAARAAAGKNAAPTRLPVDVAGAQVHVTSPAGVLTVDVTAADDRAAHEILTRAQALAPAGPGRLL